MKTLKQHLQEKEIQCRTNSLHNYDIIEAVKEWLQEHINEPSNVTMHPDYRIIWKNKLQELAEELEQ